jgi:undecaprenyl pyrophosphate phosphatase UppP
MLPNGKGTQALRDWDLWGPLVMSFLLAVVVGLSADAVNDQALKSLMFAVVFVIVAGGSLVVTFNASVRRFCCSLAV